MPNSNNVSAKKISSMTKNLTNKVKSTNRKMGQNVKNAAKRNIRSLVVNAQNKNTVLKNNNTLKKNVMSLERTATKVINHRVNVAVRNANNHVVPKVKNAVKQAVANGNHRPLERLGMAMESTGGLFGAAVRLPFNIVQRGLNAATGRKRNYGNRKGVFGHARNVIGHTGSGVTGLLAAPFKLFSRNTNNRRRKH